MICSTRYLSKPKRYKNGYVTIFFTIAISLIFSLLVTLIYSARENAIRMRTVSAADTAMTSAFAEYNKELWRQYELLFVDSSYMTDSYGMNLSEEHLKSCMNKNFEEDHLDLLGGRDLLKLKCTEAETMAVCLSTDDNYAAIKNQIVNLMKYHYKIAYFDEVEGWVKTIDNYNLSSGAAYDEAYRASSELIEQYGIDYSHWLPSESGGNSLSEDKICSWGLLSRVTDTSKVSKIKINPSVYAGSRALNKGNLSCDYSKSPIDFFYIREYAMKTCGNFRNINDQDVLKYQVEYLVSGKSSDSDNLLSVVRRILVIREAANLMTLYSSNKLDVIRGICNTICFLLGFPEIAELLVAIAAVCWSYFESITDIKILLRGGRVPLIKSGDQWITGVGAALYGDSEEADSKEGLAYEDYLRIFIYMTGENKIMSRLSDLIEMDIRGTTGNEYFRLDNCFDQWIVQIYVTSEYGYDYTLIRKRRVLN